MQINLLMPNNKCAELKTPNSLTDKEKSDLLKELFQVIYIVDSTITRSVKPPAGNECKYTHKEKKLLLCIGGYLS